MRLKPLATSGTAAAEANGYDAPSMQTLGVDGYFPEGVIADWQQVGIYRLPLASVSNQNNGGVLRRDFVGSLYSGMNVYMPVWSAPTRGYSVNQTGGMVVDPIPSYMAGQVRANPFSANADQAQISSAFVASQSPRYTGGLSLSVTAGE